MNKIKNTFGLFFVLLGILSNETLLERIFSTYAIAKLNSKVPLCFLEIGLILAGVSLLLIKIDSSFFKKVHERYKTSVIFISNIIVLLFFLNLIGFFILALREVIFYKDQIFLNETKSLQNLYPDLSGKQFKELIRETWSRRFIFEPYTQFAEEEFKGKYVNVSKNGFRFVKNQGTWPPDVKNYNIFLFGGSATFNYGVSDEQTVASYLQEFLSNVNLPKKICVYNFGRGYYYSSQERILFQKLLVAGFIPNLAIFIDGFNDFYFDKDEPLYTDKLKTFFEKGINFELPIINEKYCKLKDEEYNDSKLIQKVISRYIANKKLIEAGANAYLIKTLFVWQPTPVYKYDLQYHKFAKNGFGKFTYSKYGYKEMEKLKDKLGNNFLWLADMQEGVKKPLYIEIDHYSPEMSKDLAKNIYNFLIKKDIFK